MKCEHCGHDQPSGKFCDKCGMYLTRIQLDEPAAEPEEKRERPDKFKCRYCGHEQAKGRFCDQCGMMFPFFRALPEEAEALSARCLECGDMSTTRICPNCGYIVPGFPEEES